MRPEKNITLLAIGIIVLAAFFMLPANRDWMAQRVLHYWKDFTVQKNDLSPEHRKIRRYQNAYTFSKRIAGYFQQNKLTDQVLLLVPPASYFSAHGVNYPVPEPAVFYYYTGLKTVWANSPEAINANWIVKAVRGEVIVDKAADKSMLADSIRSYKKYPYRL